MSLSRFIRSEMPRILAEWDRFARQNAPVEPALSNLVLRDHAEEMLLAVADDIETGQTDEQQLRKSQGLGPDADRSSPAMVGEKGSGWTAPHSTDR